MTTPLNASQEIGDTPRSVEDVIEQLERVQQDAEARGREDGVACFNYLYTKITKDVLDKLKGDTFFEDKEFLRTLDVEFAKRYLDAVCCGVQGLPTTPRSWSVLFERRDDRCIKPMQFAVAGVNAHVNYDLAFAVVRTCKVLGRTLGEGSQHSDYQKINDIFAAHMRELRQHFEDSFERSIDDSAVSDLADGAGDLTVVLSRDAAWRRAEHLWTLLDDPEKTDEERTKTDWLVSMASRGILALPLL